MATVTTGYTFVNNETVTPAKLNSLAGGASVSAIVNADIDASAAIADTKLATIATTGKISNSATTAASANTASAIVARDASGNFSAGTITANVTGNVTGSGNSSFGGNVGIGTSSPNAKTEIVRAAPSSSGTPTECLRLSNGYNAASDNEAQLRFDNGSGTQSWAIGAQVSGNGYFRISGSGAGGVGYSERLRINADGTISTQTNPIMNCPTTAKAWVNFDGTATTPIAPRSSYNVSSVTKNATGDYTVNFATAMANANYSSIGTAGNAGQSVSLTTFNTTSLQISTRNASNVLTSTPIICVAIFGN
jgi:hypothetical protein